MHESRVLSHRAVLPFVLGGALLLAVLAALALSPSPAAGHEPGCNNNGHAFSFAGNCGPQGTLQMLCAASNRTGPGWSAGGPDYATHAPSPVGSSGATPNLLLQSTRGVAVNAGCGSPASAKWLLISNGWISRSTVL